MSIGGRPRSGRRLLGLLAPATFFEGYDGLILGLALPLIRDEFGLSLAEAGIVGSVALAGSFGSPLLLVLADRVGHRRVLTTTIAGYTVATCVTGLSRGIVTFIVFQFVARVFLGAEKTLASIVLVGVLPEERRGRALGSLTAMTALGQACAGLGFLLVLSLDASWRLLYLAGVAPLVLVTQARRVLGAQDEESRPVAQSPLRGKWVGAVAALGFLFALFPSAVTTFASTLVIDDWGLDITGLHPAYFVAWALGLSGFFVAGRLMDRWGRRPAAALFLAGATLAGAVTFPAATTPVRALGLAVVVFFLAGATPAIFAYTTEPFPARVRGRVGAVVRFAEITGTTAAPVLTGMLAVSAGGLGPAIAIVGCSYAIGALVVMSLLPETLPAVGVAARAG